MHIIKVRCDNSKSFRYSVLLYLYYYNMKTYKFQNYNKHINLLINNVLGKNFHQEIMDMLKWL